ncbi:hypothetical protein SDC9_100797 [bioreactor metagenome]|uniref:Uncharacterized protein n=1 Tax=bioreactor metagenome TaxID=1076179 RepID=A0A645ALB9_9ZZZZ
MGYCSEFINAYYFPLFLHFFFFTSFFDGQVDDFTG